METAEVFLKPIEASNEKVAFSNATHVLSVFQKLKKHPRAWDNVIAPMGWIAMPQKGEIGKKLVKILIKMNRLKSMAGLFSFIRDGGLNGSLVMILK